MPVITWKAGGKYYYKWDCRGNQPQAHFLDNWERYIAFCSGFGGGKTWAGAAKAVTCALHKYPGYDGLAIAPTYGDLETVVVPELIQRFDEVGITAHYHGSYPHFIWFTHPSLNKRVKIHLRSGSKPVSIKGFQVAWVWIDEAASIPKGKTPTQDVKTQALARIRGIGLPALGGGCLFMTTTHEGDMTWVCDDWITTPKPEHVLFRGSTFDNIYMTDYANGLIKQYDKRLVEQYVHGFPVNVAGILVYYAFSDEPWPKGNIDDSIAIDYKRPLILSLDFNIAPGMHGLIMQRHPEKDEIWIIDEIHRLGMHTPGLIAEFASRYGDKKPFVQIYGDATGHARDNVVGQTAYDWVKESLLNHQLSAGFMVPKSNPLVEDRVIAMNAGLEDGKGARHIRIHSRCKRFIRDMKNVQRDERGRMDKSQELKGYVHMSDAAGYYIHEVRPVGRYNVTGFTAR